jgi:hypothetical protein
MADVLDGAMSPQTILLRCLTDGCVPDVSPKDRGVDERLWHVSTPIGSDDPSHEGPLAAAIRRLR